MPHHLFLVTLHANAPAKSKGLFRLSLVVYYSPWLCESGNLHGPELEPTWQIAKEGGLGPKALTEQERDGWFITQASGGVPTEH